MAYLDDHWLAIANALVSYLAGHADVVARGFVSVSLDGSMVTHPRYPASPLTECPFVVLRNYVSKEAKGLSSDVKWVHGASLWVYRSKPSSGGQAALMTDLAVLRGVFSADPRPAPVCAAGAQMISAPEAVVHDELAHRYDDPRLRVMVGEVVLAIQARRV